MMPSILIREVSEETVKALSDRAAAAGMNREAWLRERLHELATQFYVRPAYGIIFIKRRPKRQDQWGFLGRKADGEVFSGGGIALDARGWADEVRRAEACVRRNDLGDREEAMHILRSVFDSVTEGAVEPLLDLMAQLGTLLPSDAAEGEGEGDGHD